MADQAQPKKPSDKRTATQKIADLETAIMQLFNVNDNLVKDFQNVKDALKLLNNKVSAVTQALNASEPLTDEVIAKFMVANNVSDLAEKIQNMVTLGFLVKEEQISENSFVVLRELNEEGTVVNPRLQFSLKTLDSALQLKFVGLKVGDLTKLKEDGTVRHEVLESYLIKQPDAPQAEAPAPEASPEAVAPSETQTSQG